MVEGLQKPLTPALVTDLDGTLVAGNTFRIFIRDGLSRAPLASKARICLWLLLRRLRLVSHARMKFAILPLLGKPSRAFSEKIRSLRNPEVEALIARRRAEGWTILLATAAPEVYIKDIWDGPFVATEGCGPTECRGEEKVRRVEEYLRSHGACLAEAVSDHADDTPLLRKAPSALLVCPDGSIRPFH